MTDENLTLDKSFASALRLQRSVLGEQSFKKASAIESLVPVLPCPLAWGWGSGGVNGMPVIGFLGCDSKPNYGKTTMAWEHVRWTLMAGGLAIYIGNEERPNPQYMRSLMSSLPYEARMNLVPVEVSSVNGWIEQVFDWKKKAQKFLDKEPGERVPITVVIDSLTGRGTEGEQDKAKREGIKARDYSEAAMTISRFYKNFAFEGSLLTVVHIQHSKKNQDQYAPVDERWVTNGGDAPRYASNYHFRIEKSEDFSYAGYSGRDMTVKFIKSFLGEAKRKIVVRVCWCFETMPLPAYDVYGDGEDVIFDIKWSEEEMPIKTAVEWWDMINPHIPIELAYQLGEQMSIFAYKFQGMRVEQAKAELNELEEELRSAESEGRHKRTITSLQNKVEAKREEIQNIGTDIPESVPAPLVDNQKVQKTWFDWDYSLGHLLVEGFLDNEKVSKSLKDELKSVIKMTTSGANKGYVKCEALGGVISLQQLGKAVREDPELYAGIERFLGIQKRMHFRKVPSRPKKEPRKKGRK